MTTDLQQFLNTNACGTLDDLITALRCHVRANGGVWMHPDLATADPEKIRSTTHLFEIQALGIFAAGFTLPEAAKNWRKIATYAAFGDTPFPPAPMAQLPSTDAIGAAPHQQVA